MKRILSRRPHFLLSSVKKLTLAISLVFGLSLTGIEVASAAWFSSSDPCPVSREYATLLHYLRENSPQTGDTEGNEQRRQKIAQEGATRGCLGAASRFIETDRILLKAEFPSDVRLMIAQRRAEHTDGEMRAFQSIFSSSFARDVLDLDARQSLELSEKLIESAQKRISKLPKDSKGAPSDGVWNALRETYSEITQFCSSPNTEAELPPLACAQLAAAFIEKIYASAPHAINVADQKPGKRLKEFVLFLTQGARFEEALPIQRAVTLALEVFESGEFAGENWIQAYLLGLRPRDKGGLGLGQHEARTFASHLVRTSSSQSRLSLDQKTN